MAEMTGIGVSGFGKSLSIRFRTTNGLAFGHTANAHFGFRNAEGRWVKPVGGLLKWEAPDSAGLGHPADVKIGFAIPGLFEKTWNFDEQVTQEWTISVDIFDIFGVWVTPIFPTREFHPTIEATQPVSQPVSSFSPDPTRTVDSGTREPVFYNVTDPITGVTTQIPSSQPQIGLPPPPPEEPLMANMPLIIGGLIGAGVLVILATR